MKICFLGDAASIHIRRWVEFFRDKGHDVIVISFRNADIHGVDLRYIGDNININSDGGNSAYLKNILKIRKIIKEVKPDLVNAHYLTSYGFLGSIIKDRPLVVSTWGSDILVAPKKNIVYKKLTQFVLKRCNLVTSDSNFMSEEIVKLGYDKNKVLTAPMGIDPSKFYIDKKNNNNNRTFLSMRTLCPNSNIDIILKAFKELLQEEKEIKLILTNSGEDEEKVLKLIKDLNLEEYIEFLGFVDRDKVEELLKNCKIYLSIPNSDSTSVTLLEAMACGAFPIVSDLPANREWIEDNKNGFILKDNSVEELKQLMKKALNDNDLFEKVKERNESIIKSRAIWNDNMNFIENNFKKLIR